MKKHTHFTLYYNSDLKPFWRVLTVANQSNQEEIKECIRAYIKPYKHKRDYRVFIGNISYITQEDKSIKEVVNYKEEIKL